MGVGCPADIYVNSSIQPWAVLDGRTLIQKMGPLFAKSGLVFDCEIVDTVPWLRKSSGKKSDPVLFQLWLENYLLPIIAFSTKIRDWSKFMPAGATLKNCYMPRKGDDEGDETMCVPSSFTFMVREGVGFRI